MAVPRPSSPESMMMIPSGSNHSQQNRRRNKRRCGRKPDTSSSTSSSSSSSSSSRSVSPSPYKNSFKKPSLPDHDKYLGLDCEMVGGISGESLCARAVLVDWKGNVVYDSHVMPSQPIADYRTYVSGITAEHLADAPSLQVVRAQVLDLIKGKIVVGHALDNDFGVLQITTHPWYDTRDTATYRPFLQTNRFGQQVPRKLKDLAQEKLHKQIQCPGQAHSPAVDALTALELYRTHRPRWESVIVFDLKKEREQHKRMQQQFHAQKQYDTEQRMQQQLMWQQQQQQHQLMQQQFLHRQQQQFVATAAMGGAGYHHHPMMMAVPV